MSRAHNSGRAAAYVAAGLVAVSIGCSDYTTEAPTAPELAPSFGAMPQQAFDAVMRAQERHTAALLARPGVVGTAVGRLPNGAPAIQVFVENTGVAGVPATLDGFPVSRVVSGRFWIIADPTTFARPAPLGFSVAHPNVTAGSIGFRVTDGSQVYILSNNHVLANSNNATVGDLTLQPGPADGGSTNNSDHHIGTLADFEFINFGSDDNTMDAAIAQVDPADLLGAPPADDGYGTPSAEIWPGFSNLQELIGDSVLKYGRTTGLTRGAISSVNATVTVCYAGFAIFCSLSATFKQQLIVGTSSFSAGGDSGSGVVTKDGLHPVGLLFAGSSSQTILNRIDLVLRRFGVTVDPTNEGSPDPDPVTDLAVDAVTTASPATEGVAQDVTVTVRNVGNQTITADFNIALRDATTDADIGTPQGVSTDLGPNATASRTFSWTPTAPTGTNHTLEGSHTLGDDNSSNNTKTTSVAVNAGGGGSGTTMHVAALGGSSTNNGSTWTAEATITIRDDQNNLVSNATVSGSWSNGTTGSDNCITNGNGVCTISKTGIAKRTGSVLFTVTNVTHGTLTYNSGANVASSVTISKP